MLKWIGRELLEHPEIEDVLIQPFKSRVFSMSMITA